MNKQEVKKKSRFLSFVLRHNPGKYNLSMDYNGFVDLEELKENTGIDADQIREVIKKSDKNRFQIEDGKVRALYGHSIDLTPDYAEFSPDKTLYHGTTPNNAKQIEAEGLKPMSREFVHLSTSLEDARQVARRRTNSPVIFKVKTQEALQEGIKFYKAGEMILVEELAPEFLERI